MRNLAVSLLGIVLTALVILAGCSEENLKPYFTRLTTSGECGVAPFEVEFLAIASGGNEDADPTGANLWYEIRWEFGDGTTAQGSKAYHIYQDPGTYQVFAIARDSDGDEARISTTIEVHQDSLRVVADASVPSGSTIVAGRDTLTFDVDAFACGLDTADDSQYSRFQFRWTMPDGIVFTGRRPAHAFDVTLVDTQWVRVDVEDHGRSLNRSDSLFFVLETPPARFLDFFVDMRGVTAVSPDGVHVTGSFNGWDPAATELTDAENDTIYFARIEVAPGSTQLFRFVNGNTDAQRETVPAACRVSDGMGGFARRVLMGNDDVVYQAAFATCPQ